MLACTQADFLGFSWCTMLGSMLRLGYCHVAGQRSQEAFACHRLPWMCLSHILMPQAVVSHPFCGSILWLLRAVTLEAWHEHKEGSTLVILSLLAYLQG